MMNASLGYGSISKVNITHILQAYLTGTKKIMWLLHY